MTCCARRWNRCQSCAGLQLWRGIRGVAASGSRVKKDLPVLFIDTEMLFPETLAYQREVAERWA